jgi:hypothetical protein
MRLVRRPIALLSALLVAHVVLLGGGVGCATPMSRTSLGYGASPRVISAADRGSAEMPGMPGMPMRSVPGRPDAPCNLPWAPAACQGMVPCGPAALATPPAPTVAAVAPVPEPAITLVVLAPPSRSTTPEPPPPRA